MYKFSFKNEEEKIELIKSNKDKRLIEVYYSPQENFILLSNEPILENKISILNEQNSKLLLDKAKNEIQINTLNKNLANVTLEVAKMKGGM